MPMPEGESKEGMHSENVAPRRRIVQRQLTERKPMLIIVFGEIQNWVVNPVRRK